MTVLAGNTPPLCLPPVPMGRPPNWPLPAGATDTHFHVFKAGAPLAPVRSYTPQIATLEDWLAFAEAAGIASGVAVQPSVYGFDNTVLLDALRAVPARLRGIAVVDPHTPAAELERLHGRGVRGIRCNTRNLAGLGFDAALGLARRIAPLGWVLQLQVGDEELDALADLAPRLGIRLILDHLGSVDLRSPERALRRLHTLLDTGRCFVKLSAPYRLSRVGGYADYSAIVAALVRSHPERLLWGSDWPHTELWDVVPDDADLIDGIVGLLSGEALRRTILVDTPRSLFFAEDRD